MPNSNQLIENDWTYEKAWRFLDDLQFHKIKLGLAPMAEFLGRLGNPQKKLACIHIGGTNGKGSTGATLLSILNQAGYRAGFYTSPHLSDVRERFRINNSYISKEEFTVLTKNIVDILGDSQITYFEFTTTLALLWFAQKKVDIAILEVGMGGRLDATNVVTPLVSIITNVSMDHEQYLGSTLAEIAFEKAGIIKFGIPVISGVVDDVAGPVIKKQCTTLQSPLHILGNHFSGNKTGMNTWNFTFDGKQKRTLPLAMKGAYQVENASLALAAVAILGQENYQITDEHIKVGLADVHWPGRLEEFWLDENNAVTCKQPELLSRYIHFLLDGAHNKAGINALTHSLGHEFSYNRLILIWAAMEDKDLKSPLQSVVPLADQIILTRPESERAADPQLLQDLLPDSRKKDSLCTHSVEEALAIARNKAEPGDLICVAGSLYLVGRARELLIGGLVEA